MEIFQKTSKQKDEFDAFNHKIDVICEELEPYSKKISIESIRNIKRNFQVKTDNFFSEDRKLNIGVIGRMKAGKSTFLNTLLFDGKDVLPCAVTPKTATLTKIEYGSKNALEVDFYTKDEWEILMQHVNSDIDSNQAQVAKEIMALVEKNEIDPKEYINKEKQIIYYESHEELMKELQQYVSESGKYTPFVKSTVIYIDNEELVDMMIVDTPGFDDPIQSRTAKTKDFMELCDVVFFLSKASSFMNHEDIDLFMNQLPNKGVKKMVFICSRFDDGLRDLIWSCDSITDAIKQLKQKLLTFGVSTINNYKQMHYSNSALINQNFEPVFVSSMVSNMLKKDKKDYTVQEKKVYDDLNLRGDLTDEILQEIANFDCLHEELD
ncbi:MAG: dynamin family protein, partial [Clostridiales bacterium]|nr:dynamin family protein [Clostridiales bacterium]